MKAIEFLKGKKQYITAIAVGVCAGLEAYGVNVPEAVYLLLASFGIYANRAAIAATKPA